MNSVKKLSDENKSDVAKWVWKNEWWIMSDEWRKLSDEKILPKQALYIANVRLAKISEQFRDVLSWEIESREDRDKRG